MVNHNYEIISEIFSMSDDQLKIFIAGLKYDTLEYLEVILAKAETQLPLLKQQLDKKKN